MLDFLRTRSQSLAMVVLVLLLIVAAQGGISYTLTFGRLDSYIPQMKDSPVSAGWLALRVALIGVTVVLWLLRRKRALFRAIDVQIMIRESGFGAQRFTVTPHKRQDLAGQLDELVQRLVHGCRQVIESWEVLQVRGLLLDLLPQELDRIEVR